MADLIVKGGTDIQIAFSMGVATDERLSHEFEPAAVSHAAGTNGIPYA